MQVAELEARLRGCPGVTEAAVVIREDALVAYVVANFSQLKRLQRDRPVSEWQAIIDAKYSTAAPGPSFVGWDSSYTGEPIPDEAMQEWLSNTALRILELAPRKVLEIGCGVGLLVEQLAPRCEVYRATDVSGEAIKSLRVWLGRKPHLRHVRLQQGSAAQVTQLPRADCDTVILNSVVQYFPDIEYLHTVLEGAVSQVSSEGQVFIGDVRHHGLLRVFHSSVQLARAAPDLRVKELRTLIARAIENERELLIDPRYFEELPERIPRISAVHVLPKGGSPNTEMTRYRYDVVLQIGAARLVGPQEQMSWPSNADVLTSQLIDAAEETTTVEALRKEQSAAHAEPGAYPEMPDRAYANDPWKNLLRQQLIRELRQSLNNTVAATRLHVEIRQVPEVKYSPGDPGEGPR